MSKAYVIVEAHFHLVLLHRVNVAMSWEPALEMNLTGSLKGNWEHRLLCEGLGLPAMTDSEWGALAPDSLPASLQHQLWPTDQLGGAAQVGLFLCCLPVCLSAFAECVGSACACCHMFI